VLLITEEGKVAVDDLRPLYFNNSAQELSHEATESILGGSGVRPDSFAALRFVKRTSLDNIVMGFDVIGEEPLFQPMLWLNGRNYSSSQTGGFNFNDVPPGVHPFSLISPGHVTLQGLIDIQPGGAYILHATPYGDHMILAMDSLPLKNGVRTICKWEGNEIPSHIWWSALDVTSEARAYREFLWDVLTNKHVQMLHGKQTFRQSRSDDSFLDNQYIPIDNRYVLWGGDVSHHSRIWADDGNRFHSSNSTIIAKGESGVFVYDNLLDWHTGWHELLQVVYGLYTVGGDYPLDTFLNRNADRLIALKNRIPTRDLVQLDQDYTRVLAFNPSETYFTGSVYDRSLVQNLGTNVNNIVLPRNS